MKAVVYSKDACPYCVKVKQVLESLGIQITEYKFQKDFDRDQFYAEFGEGATFPQVLLDEEHVGGCTETVKYLRQKNLV
jgi:glutaredoxin|tara:strand:+ start:484 stop:720 length:237 start_codon:yes stop_codon:yes gene_type:complete